MANTCIIIMYIIIILPFFIQVQHDDLQAAWNRKAALDLSHPVTAER